MISLDAAAATRIPIVLVVDPVASSRQLAWRVLSRSFGVLEAPDARGALDWIARRPDIEALVVQHELPDGPGRELVHSLVAARMKVASRALLVGRPMDAHAVLASLTDWCFTRESRKAEPRRTAQRLVS